MFRRYAGGAQFVPLRESRVFDQPCRRNLALRLRGGVTGNVESSRRSARGEIFELRLRQHRVLEKRARTAAIVVARDDQHSLASPYLKHRRTSFGERWRSFPCGETFGE